MTKDTGVSLLTEFRDNDLNDICEACEAAIADGGGFGWLKPPPRQTLEAFWEGVLLVPLRTLFVARLEGVICGSAQLYWPPANNQAQSFSANLQSVFMAPWARGHGLARKLTEAVEAGAREGGFDVLTLDVRETQEAAITLYESLGFVRWGSNPKYARVNGRYITGHYYYKDLTEGLEDEDLPRFSANRDDSGTR